MALLLLAGLGGGVYHFLRRPAPPMVITTATPTPATPVPSVAPTPVSAPLPTPPTESPIILRLHGSSAVGETLIPALVEAFLRQEHATQIQRTVGNEPGDAKVQGTFPGDISAKIIEISPASTGEAFSDLAADRCDVALASREVNTDETQRLHDAGKGDMTSKDCQHIFALDALAMVVHPSNPIAELSKDQIAQIFTGQITNWSQVRGTPGAINICTLPDASDSSEAFRSLVLAGTNIAATAHRLRTSDEVSDSVCVAPGAIGFVELPSIGNARPIAVSAGTAAPLLPNHFDIATEDYVLSRRLYLYTPAHPASDWASRFVSFVLSRAGQEVVERTGFISLRPRVGPPKVRADAPEDYKKLAKDADRLDVNFRFETASSQLDNKALLDLDLIADLLSKPPYQGRYILLFGFADSVGTPQANLTLSKARAETVAKQLQSRHISPAVVTGFGKELPVDTNDTEKGREKNRRVEVWLRQ